MKGGYSDQYMFLRKSEIMHTARASVPVARASGTDAVIFDTISQVSERPVPAYAQIPLLPVAYTMLP